MANIGNFKDITNIASDFEIVATFKNLPSITASQIITNFFNIVKNNDHNYFGKFAFITDKVIDFPTLTYMRLLTQSDRLGDSEFKFNIDGSDQTFTGINDETSFDQFMGREKSITADELTAGCTVEDAKFTTFKITAVNPATGGADLASCLSNIDIMYSFQKVLHINLSGATGLLDDGSQIDFDNLLRSSIYTLEELEIDMSGVTFVSSLDNFYPAISSQAALKKYKANYTKNNLRNKIHLNTHLTTLRDMSLIELEVIFQGETSETNLLAVDGVKTVVDNFILYDQPDGSTQRSINRKLFISDGFKICEAIYNNSGGSSNCEWTSYYIQESERYPMNCPGETIEFQAQVSQPQASPTDFDNNNFTWGQNLQYFRVPFSSSTLGTSVSIDISNYNTGRTNTIFFSPYIIQKGDEQIPYEIVPTKDFEVYQCMPRANILINKKPVQEEYSNCQDLEFTIEFDNPTDASLIVPETHFEWNFAYDTILFEGFDQKFIVRANQLTGVYEDDVNISVTIKNSDFLVREANFKINQCQASSTILVNGASPAVSYPDCNDLQLSLGEIIGNAKVAYDSVIIWRVSQNGQSIVGTQNVSETSFNISSDTLEADKTYQASVSILGPYIRVQEIDINIIAGTCAAPAVEATESSTLLQVSLLLILILATIV